MPAIVPAQKTSRDQRMICGEVVATTEKLRDILQNPVSLSR